MSYYIIYNKKDGEILHVHSVFDGAAGTYLKQRKEDVLSTLTDFVLEPETVDVLAVRGPLCLREMRVNPTTKKLEKIPSTKEGRV